MLNRKTVLIALMVSVSFFVQATSIRPSYPTYALDNCIEGFVVFQFEVSENGRAKNTTITESHPAGIFDKAALNNLSRMYFAREAGAIIDNHKLTFKIENLKKCEEKLHEPKT